MKGWICLHRSIQEHWIWQDPVKLKWWIDILISVNHEGKKVNIGLKLIECDRGQSVLSLSNWAKRWNVSKHTVNNFFTLLKNDNMITTENLIKTIRITVCKYDTYQDVLNASGTDGEQSGNASGTDGETNNNDNNDNNEKQNIKAEFEIFFNAYHSITKLSKTDKQAAEKYFVKLSKKDRQKALDNIKPYFDSLRDKSYCKKCRTYLSDKNYNDEFNPNNTSVVPGPNFM